MLRGRRQNLPKRQDPKAKKRLNHKDSAAVTLIDYSIALSFTAAIENLHLGVRRDAKQPWRRLKPYRLVKSRFEVPDGLVHDDDCRAVIHADHAAESVIDPNDVPSPQSKRMPS
jgi:hypothetical protein